MWGWLTQFSINIRLEINPTVFTVMLVRTWSCFQTSLCLLELLHWAGGSYLRTVSQWKDSQQRLRLDILKTCLQVQTRFCRSKNSCCSTSEHQWKWQWKPVWRVSFHHFLWNILYLNQCLHSKWWRGSFVGCHWSVWSGGGGCGCCSGGSLPPVKDSRPIVLWKTCSRCFRQHKLQRRYREQPDLKDKHHTWARLQTWPKTALITFQHLW